MDCEGSRLTSVSLESLQSRMRLVPVLSRSRVQCTNRSTAVQCVCAGGGARIGASKLGGGATRWLCALVGSAFHTIRWILFLTFDSGRSTPPPRCNRCWCCELLGSFSPPTSPKLIERNSFVRGAVDGVESSLLRSPQTSPPRNHARDCCSGIEASSYAS